MLEKFEKKYTAIFLGDSIRPASLILLKRTAKTKVAPGLYTGPGGKIEPGENQQQCALRELKEETGITGVKLTEFARIILNGKRIFCYFYGIYNASALPECNEGVLERVFKEDVFKKDLIPTVALMLKEWQNRGWSADNPFTLYLEREDMENVHGPIRSSRTKDGLLA